MQWKKPGYLVSAFLFCIMGSRAQAPQYDLVISGGTLLDGSGNPGSPGDIAIKDGRIAAIGRIATPASIRTIDAGGALVVPGFIDIHTHGDRDVASDRLKSAQNYIAQGVTTIVTGNCGGGTFEVGGYFDTLRRQGAGLNVIHLAGHGTVRSAVMQSADRAPTAAELDRMKSLVDRAMREGAAGISSGLFYAPGSFAKVDEVVELAKVVKKYGGIYTTHIRDESNYTTGLRKSIEEAIEVGEKAGVRVEISHIKALGKPVWGMAPEICRVIEAAQARGVQVFADQYPYEASGTSLTAATLARWVQADDKTRERLQDPMLLPKIKQEMAENIERRGGPETLRISSFRARPEWQGKNLLEISRTLGKSPVDTAVEMLLMGGAGVTSFNMSEADIEFFMRKPYVATCSDGDIVAFGSGMPHPRSYAAFTRKIRRYVIERKTIPMEQAIRAATGLPAEILGLKDRGLLKAGFAADIVILDPSALADKATYENPHQYADGIRCVLVNGEVAVEGKRITGILAGKPLPAR
ncbi:MAG: D-aminoacylase [Acidobacteria bacterium]|nr:D-aminoacylase [Acidobacteriota bacterium]